MAVTKSLADFFMINGTCMFAPDADVVMSFEDLDAPDSGRDEAGIMHRIVVRYKVGKWQFEYAYITEEEMRYMEALFPDAPDFSFTHPSRTNSSVMETTTCYRSKYAISWRNAVTGQWRNYKFDIIEC